MYITCLSVYYIYIYTVCIYVCVCIYIYIYIYIYKSPSFCPPSYVSATVLS